MRRLVLIIALLPLMGFAAFAQQLTRPAPTEVSIGNVYAERVDHKFYIKYSIILGDQVEGCDVGIFVSIDGGKSFTSGSVNKFATGDVGVINSSGEKAVILTLDKSGIEKMADMPVVFKVSASNVKCRGLFDNATIGQPALVKWNGEDVYFSLKIEGVDASLIDWKGICYSDRHSSPTFEDSEVKIFMKGSRENSVVLKLVRGKKYYLRGIVASSKDGQIIYGKTVPFILEDY